jgi:hypothetical protein
MQGQGLNPWIPLHCCLATKHFIPLSKILHVKCVIFLSYFNEIWSFSTDFLKSCQCQILRNLSNLSRTDARKQVNTWTINRHDKANIRFSATCANPRNIKNLPLYAVPCSEISALSTILQHVCLFILPYSTLVNSLQIILMYTFSIRNDTKVLLFVYLHYYIFRLISSFNLLLSIFFTLPYLSCTSILHNFLQRSSWSSFVILHPHLFSL